MMAYIGRKPACGCVVTAIANKPDDPRWVAERVAEAVRDGLVIEYVSDEYVKEHFRSCKCEPEQQRLDV